MHCSSVIDSPQEPGAELLMASLLSQLLVSFPWEGDDGEDSSVDFNALFNGGKYTISEIKEWRLEALCSLFLDLVRSLPKDQIVFILIDGINYYEYEDLKDGMVFATQELLELVQTEGLKAICKVLITSAAQSVAVGMELSSDMVMKLKRELPREDKGFNSRRRLMHDGEEMERRGKLFRKISRPDELEESEADTSGGESVKSETGNKSEVYIEGSSEDEETLALPKAKGKERRRREQKPVASD